MKNIAIHHSAVSSQAPQLYAINRYHKQKWGMKSSRGWYVGYNYLIDSDATVTLTRAIGEETIAQKGHNCDVPSRCDTISICLAGNFNNEFLWQRHKQEKALEELIISLKKVYPNIKVVGHKDLQKGRTCPGSNIDKDDFKEWNKLPLNDKVDEEKEAQIKLLQAKLDSARNALHRLKQRLHA